jgi:ubiquinone/menaquinone biosynthesis C-methylase UbiE
MDSESMKYFKVYEILYREGYHSMLKNHGQQYVENIIGNHDFKSMLEIGCSNGMAIKQFKKRRKLCYGVDVSHIAIRYAAEKAFVPNCILASATDIPFVDNFVDAVFSCDVFEHLTEKDVHKALRQVKRLTKKFFFVVLDCHPERNRDWIEKCKQKYPVEFKDIDNLHLTIWEPSKWRSIIQGYGFRFLRKYRDLYCFEKYDYS